MPPRTKRSKYPTLTLFRIGSTRVDLLNGKADWREYLAWQLGLLAGAAALLPVLLLLWHPERTTDLAALNILLATLPGIVVASAVLWWLIAREYSRSKRFALAFLILAAVSIELIALATFGTVPSSVWFNLLLTGTVVYLIGTGAIGLVIFIRGDDVSPWWKR